MEGGERLITPGNEPEFFRETNAMQMALFERSKDFSVSMHPTLNQPRMTITRNKKVGLYYQII